MKPGAVAFSFPVVQQICVLGDSIAAGFFDEEGLGWASRLSQKLAREFPLQYGVQNASVSGDTTLDAWHTLNSHVTRLNPAILIIALGVNDVCVYEGVGPGVQACPWPDRIFMWHGMLDYVQKMGWKTLIVGPTAAGADIARYPVRRGLLPQITGFRFEQAHIRRYNDDLQKLCAERKVPFLRVFETWEQRLASSESLLGRRSPPKRPWP
ncbi:MAG: SGNH/GDSL hydrolase family protein [Pseudomonadota bacterium]|nr:SGNH/GDSL hydrolase family protein [Pseudomonadota bacterium]